MSEKIEFAKRPIEDIKKDAETIDTGKIASEVLVWLICNVENFIDNQTKMFKLDLVLDEARGTEETKKLQDLYRAIPDDDRDKPEQIEEAEQCRRLLDDITKKACNIIKTSEELLKELFERMSFYYGRIIPNPENKKRALVIDEDLKKLFQQKEESPDEQQKERIQQQIVEKIKGGESLIKFTELKGIVNIVNFEYEAFDVGVKISNGNKQDENRNVVKEYVIPEGFVIWVEIRLKYKQRPTVMF